MMLRSYVVPGRRDGVGPLRGSSASTGCNGRTPGRTACAAATPRRAPPEAVAAIAVAVGGIGSGARGGSGGGVGGAAARPPCWGYLTGTPACSRLRWIVPQASPTSLPSGRFRLFSQSPDLPVLLGAPATEATLSQILGLDQSASQKPLERCPVVFLCAARMFLAKTAHSGSAIKRPRSVGCIDDHDVPAGELPDLHSI